MLCSFSKHIFQVSEVPEGQPSGSILARHCKHPQVLCCCHRSNPSVWGACCYFVHHVMSIFQTNLLTNERLQPWIMQDQKDIYKLRHPGTGMGGYLGYQWGARSENRISSRGAFSESTFSGSTGQIPIPSPTSWTAVFIQGWSKLQTRLWIHRSSASAQFLTLGFNQVEWSVLKLHWVAKELLIRNGANLQVSSRKRAQESTR